LERIALELQESGRDENSVIQATISNNTGINNTDILRFSVPLCLCGSSAIDDAGEVKDWGAPSQWGQAGCDTSWPLNGNGDVDICHYVSPGNYQDLEVDTSAVNAHLAHGDYIGDCSACDPSVYTNALIEYSIDSSNRLLRKVLNAATTVLSSTVIAEEITDFQASFGAVNVVNLTLQASDLGVQGRTITLSGNRQVILRNYD
jgi:hypothetical protein